MDLTMGMSLTRPIVVTWDASPDAVASALARAIEERRYEDAGDATKAAWCAAGRIDGHSLDLLVTSVGAPGGSGYGLSIWIRGELVDDRGGTRLKGQADGLGRGQRWLMPAMVVWLAGLPAVIAALEGGLLTALVVFAVILVPAWLLSTFAFSFASRNYLSVIPRVEAVLARLGAPPAGG